MSEHLCSPEDRCEICDIRRTATPQPEAGRGAVEGYATIGEVWEWVANELDETRTPEDAARLMAAMEALRRPSVASEGEPVAWEYRTKTRTGWSWWERVHARDIGQAELIARQIHADYPDGECQIRPLYTRPASGTPAVTEAEEDFERILAEMRQPPLTNHAPDALRRAFVDGWHDALNAIALRTERPE